MIIARKHLHLIVLGAAAVLARDARADMVARWTLDDGVTGIQNVGSDGATSDLMAATPVASISGGPTFVETGGKLGGFATFNGNQALITTTTGNAGDDLASYPFTLSAWIRPPHPTGTARGAVVAISNTVGANTYFTVGIETLAEGEKVEAVRRNSTFFDTNGTGTNLTAYNGDWHHIAVVNASSTSSRLYYDGAEVGFRADAVTFSSGINSVSIGAFMRQNAIPWTDKYTGDVDEVQVYNDALIASQIQFLFNNPAGPAPPIAACDVDLINGCTIADLQIIANHFFTNTINRTDGDLNSDGIVNFADYRIWKDASGSGATLGDVMGVPEPATLGCLALILPWLCLCGSRHRAQR